MKEIPYLLKFGQSEHMSRLKEGKLYFSTAPVLRRIETELRIKGQGDRLEGVSKVHASQLEAHDNFSKGIVMSEQGYDLLFRYEAADRMPVFCLFACSDDECVSEENSIFRATFSDQVKAKIKRDFPKADTVAIITNPQQFISDVHISLGEECKSGLVSYFFMEGIERPDGVLMDLQYVKYLTQDIAPKRVGNCTVYSFDEAYVYRALFCKDICFKDHQEYRFVIPSRKIERPQEIEVSLNCQIELTDLQTFFGTSGK